MDGILNDDLGIAIVRGSVRESIIATAMQYGRTDSGGINYLYGIQGKQPLGASLKGSYNTFLNQSCTLMLSNPSDYPATAIIEMTRFDGAKVLSGETLQVPAHGLETFDICSHDQVSTYGVVSVDLDRVNSMTAHIIRTGRNGEYRFPTEVRE